MAKKQTIEALVLKLEKESEQLKTMTGDLDKTLKHYQSTINLSRDILEKINQHKKSFSTLKKDAENLIT